VKRILKLDPLNEVFLRETMREAVINYVKWAIERFPYQELILDTCAGWEPIFIGLSFPGKRYIKQDMQDFDPPALTSSAMSVR
jgi:hypothetical protein